MTHGIPRARVAFSVAAFCVATALAAAAQVPPPDAHFGFRMGADRQLASAEAIEQYFELVAATSDRVKIADLGATTEGHRTIAAIVSAAENISTLDRIRADNQRLADPRSLPADEAHRLASSHKVVIAIGCSIHANEIGASQAASELLYSFATTTDPAQLDELRNVVIVLVPMLNPDGYRLVVDWYGRYRDTPFEGGPMPWLDHKYAGHDINRDGFMMNMAESRNLSRFFYTEWHPQVFLSMHQMGPDGPRFFAPPIDDPIGPNYDPLVWREAALLGSAMTLQLERDHLSGVLSNGVYDYYWPGYEDSVPLGHNTVCLLTEAASARLATPVTVNPVDLQAELKGLPAYLPQINFPNPWPGGRWSLRDIVDYDVSAVRGLVHAVSAYRQELVENFYEMGRQAVARGGSASPFAFLIPSDQRDPYAVRKLEELLLQGSIEIHRTLEPFWADGEPYPTGTDVILLAQPYRAYVKTLLERQDYPVRRSAPDRAAEERPYDATAWTLPAQVGVEVETIERTFEPPAMSRITTATIEPARVWGVRKPSYYLIDARGTGGAIAANRLLKAGAKVAWLTSALDADGYHYPPGSLVAAGGRAVDSTVSGVASSLGLRIDAMSGKPPATLIALRAVRVGVYQSRLDNADEGWTRWVLEQYEFPYTSLHDADVRAGNLRSRFDAIVLPSMQPAALRAGRSVGEVPPEYAGGLGDDGVTALEAFVKAGGSIVCLDQACPLAVDMFGLPVRDVTRSPDAGGFSCPGSILRIDLDTSEPLAYGMEPHTAGFFSDSSAYEIAGPAPVRAAGNGEGAVRTVARYAEKDLLVSGWIESEGVIAGRAAVVEAKVGAGRVVLIGFRAQNRGESLATFRLLFNALFTAR
jgi:hypothetical protein